MKKCLISLFPLLMLLAAFPIASAEAATSVKIVPQSYEAFDPPVSNIILNVTVENVQGMVGYEIYIFFNSSILTCNDIILPSDFVYAGQGYLETDKLIDNDKGEIHYGVSTFPFYKFNGSGVLCQLNFTGEALGDSDIIIVTPDMGTTFYTQLLNENAEEIPYTAYNGVVSVIPEFSPLALLTLIAMASTSIILLRKRKNEKE